MKFLVIGDQHFKISNHVQVEIFLTQLESFLQNNPLDFIVSAGDLLDTHEKLHTSCLNMAVKYLTLLSNYALTYVLVGNHDALNNQIFLNDNHWLNCLKNHQNLIIVDRVVKSKDFVYCPYVPNGRFVEALNTVDWKTSHFIFGHQELNGVKMGMITSENVEEWLEDYPMCISGHIHDKQKVKDNLYYVGSSMQHGFNENVDKSLLLVSDKELREDSIIKTNKILNCREYYFYEVYLDLPKKMMIHLESGELNSYNFSEKTNDQKLQIKFIIHGSSEEFNTFKKTNMYKNLIRDKVKFDFKHKKIVLIQKHQDLQKKLTRVKRPFDEILNELINTEKNDLLNKLYRELK